jgi:hypothetical protein
VLVQSGIDERLGKARVRSIRDVGHRLE